MFKMLAKPDEVCPRSISSPREEWLDSSLNYIAWKETGQTQDLDKWESKAYPGKGKWPIKTVRGMLRVKMVEETTQARTH